MLMLANQPLWAICFTSLVMLTVRQFTNMSGKPRQKVANITIVPFSMVPTIDLYSMYIKERGPLPMHG